MSEPYIGQIMQAGFNYAPRGWSTCEGQILSINQNTTLFALLGVTFGGNGQSTFGLPNAASRVFVGTGQGAGLSPYIQGQMSGVESTTLTLANMPAHNHQAVFQGQQTSVAVTGQLQAYTGVSTQTSTPAEGSTLANAANAGTQQVKIYAPANSGGTPVNLGGLTIGGGGAITPAGSVTVGVTGSNFPVSILQPYLAINTVIALTGIYPSRN
jgi:microcystin-dependent protein